MTASAILLDLDRTLVDLQSATDYAAALRDVQAIIGAWPEADVPDTDWDRPTQACMSVLHSLLGDLRWHQVSDAIAVHERAACPKSFVMPTVPDALATLAIMPTAVVTLLPPDVARDVLTRNGIGIGPGQPVDLVVGRDAEIRPKPFPDGILVACELLDVRPEDATMIGDSTWDLEAAVNAGADFIGIPAGTGVFGPDVRVARSLAEAVRLAAGG